MDREWIYISEESHINHIGIFSCHVIYWFWYFTVIANKAEERRKTIEINRDDSEKMKFLFSGKQMNEIHDIETRDIFT